MTWFTGLAHRPFNYDMFDSMRRIERTLGKPQAHVPATPEDVGFAGIAELRAMAPRPRIGDSATRRDETIVCDGVEYLVSFGQQPHLEFPASNVARVDFDEDSTRKRMRVYTKFLGLLGPEGALPLAITEEAYGYAQENDRAFPDFLDIFNNRFLQLFFRAWADSRPIVHNDRPDFDRFHAYVKSMVGVGTPPFEGLATIPDGIGLYAGLLAPRARGASRLRNAITGLFGVRAEIEQFVGTWLEFEEPERSMLGARNSGLGSDLLVGKASYSVQDKFRVRIYAEDLETYALFLPEGATCEKLVDLVYFYVGDEFEWDVELALPAPLATPVRLGASGQLGWTTWMAPNYPANEYRCDARFSPAERVARRRRKKQ